MDILTLVFIYALQGEVIMTPTNEFAPYVNYQVEEGFQTGTFHALLYFNTDCAPYPQNTTPETLFYNKIVGVKISFDVAGFNYGFTYEYNLETDIDQITLYARYQNWGN